MSNTDNIYTDAGQPATLRHSGRSVDCFTLQEAVLDWMRLPDQVREQATIRVHDGRVYTAREIDLLHIAPTPYTSMVKDGTYQVKVPLVGHALPHVFPHVFHSQDAAEKWMQSAEGGDLIKQVWAKLSPADNDHTTN